MQRWPLPTKVLSLGGQEGAAEAAGARAAESTQGTARAAEDTTFAGVLRSKGAAWTDTQVNPSPDPKP